MKPTGTFPPDCDERQNRIYLWQTALKGGNIPELSARCPDEGEQYWSVSSASIFIHFSAQTMYVNSRFFLCKGRTKNVIFVSRIRYGAMSARP